MTYADVSLRTQPHSLPYPYTVCKVPLVFLAKVGFIYTSNERIHRGAGTHHMAAVKKPTQRKVPAIYYIRFTSNKADTAHVSTTPYTCVWLELRRLPPIIGFVGSAPGLVTLLA